MKDFYSKLDTMELDLAHQIETIQAIDAHEHLPTEEQRLSNDVDALTLFSHYCRGDMAAAGMRQAEVDYVLSKAPLMDRWRKFKPYYQHIRDSAYARAAHIAMQRFYGEIALDDVTVEKVSHAMKAANTKGLYQRVLVDACNLKTCLNQSSDRSTDGLLTPVYWAINNPRTKSDLTAQSKALGREIRTLDDLLDAGRKYIDDIKAKGGVGLKFFVFPMSKPNVTAAREAFASLFSGKTDALPLQNPVSDMYFDAILTKLAQVQMVACVHTGYWGDFRQLHPSNAIDMVDNYKDTSFDIYHIGYPYVRDTIMLGKTRSNVWLNMCWTYIISEQFAHDALSEMLDMVPTNKIIGFGGDYIVVEKVFGHLTIARQTIARALCARVRQGLLTMDRAFDLADKILRRNPSALYNLN